MKLIIDGYNLLKGILEVEYVLPEQRESFLQLLGQYAKFKKLQLVIVFDGGDGYGSYRETCYGIEVFYSGVLESADDVIAQLVQTERGRVFWVVTSDRELASLASDCGADVIKSKDFYQKLRLFGREVDFSLPVKNSVTYKIAKNNDPNIDQLMIQSIDFDQDNTEPKIEKKLLRGKKMPKAERQRRQKLKKL